MLDAAARPASEQEIGRYTSLEPYPQPYQPREDPRRRAERELSGLVAPELLERLTGEELQELVSVGGTVPRSAPAVPGCRIGERNHQRQDAGDIDCLPAE